MSQSDKLASENTNSNIFEKKKSFAVWDYPLSQTFTKLWNTMDAYGWLKNLNDGIESVLASNGEHPFVLLEDTVTAKYLASKNCQLTLMNVKQMAKKSYGFAFGKDNFMLRDLFSQSILEMRTNGVLDSLLEKWWTPCGNDKGIDGSISLNNTGGAFILLGIGIFTVVSMQLVQLLSRKSKNILNKKIVNRVSTAVQTRGDNLINGSAIQSITYF